MTKSDNYYAIQVMISNAALHSKEDIFNDTWNNVGTISSSQGAMFPNSGYKSIIPFQTKGYQKKII